MRCKAASGNGLFMASTDRYTQTKHGADRRFVGRYMRMSVLDRSAWQPDFIIAAQLREISDTFAHNQINFIKFYKKIKFYKINLTIA